MNKKLISILFLLFACLSGQAEEVKVGDYLYSYDTSTKEATIIYDQSYEGMTEVVIPESIMIGDEEYTVTTVRQHAFHDLPSLRKIELPSTLTTIEEYAFTDCRYLETVISHITEPFEIYYNTFRLNLFEGTQPEGTRSNAVLYVPVDCKEKYKAFPGWTQFAGIKEMRGETFTGLTTEGVEMTFIVTSYAAKTCLVGTEDENVQAIDKTYQGAVTIPSTINGYTVTGITEYAFSNCTGLTSVIISQGVKSIGDAAFMDCHKLVSVSIPEGLNSIGTNAFIRASLVNLTLPSNSINFGSGAFMDNKLVTVVSKFNHAGRIPINVFRLSVYDERFGDYEIPSKATLYVPEGSLEEYVESTGWDQFAKTEEITNITFQDSNVKAICVENWDTDGDGELLNAEAAFVTSLGEVFKKNKNITSFDELKYFTGLTTIGESDFNVCSNLTSIIIPQRVTSINAKGFEECKNLSSIKVESDNAKYSTPDNSNAIIETKTKVLVLGGKNTVIPDDITSIGDYAFSDRIGLTSITIPNNVTTIGEAAFERCFDLTSVTLPEGLTSIGKWGFSRCAIVNLTLPSTLTAIGDKAFWNNELTTVISNIEEPFEISIDVFQTFYVDEVHEYVFPSSASLYVPKGSKTKYNTIAGGWTQFVKIEEIGGGEPEPLKCAKPTVSVVDGQIQFSCETEGVEFVSQMKVGDADTYHDSAITLPQKYTVTVYATKEGYEDSDVTTEEFVISGSGPVKNGDMNGDGEFTITDVIMLMDLLLTTPE